MTTNVFERASRQKYRFASAKGDLTTEQLWDLPLTSSTQANLNSIGMEIQDDIARLSKGSLVETASSKVLTVLEDKLEIIKHIIATKQEDRRKAESRAARAAERQKLLEVLNDKNEDELKSLSREEILKKLEAIDAED